MNRKGFAVSGILYTILLIFLAIIYMLLMNFKNKKNLLDQMKSEVLNSSKLCEEKVGQTFTFDYTGEAQEFIAECEGEYKIELWGASGNTTNPLTFDYNGTTYHGGIGGKGAYTSGKIELSKNTKLYMYVGGSGSPATSATESNGGGYNGGGNNRLTTANSNYAGTGGGGATDVRFFGSSEITDSDLEWNSDLGLKSRIMVAGAGGGGAAWNQTGGAGGGLSGYDGEGDPRSTAHLAGGGTQTTGGVGSGCGTSDSNNSWCSQTINPGTFGIGGSGIPQADGGPGGSGGAGYYGGGAGGDGYSYSGGGGSSFISGHAGSLAITSSESTNIKTGCNNLTDANKLECSTHYSGLYFKETKMIDGTGYEWTTEKGSEVVGMPTHNGESTMNGNSGNGYAKITYLGKKVVRTCNISVGDEYTFEYTGNAQDFTVPCNGYYKLEVWGAQGTNYTASIIGGYGGYSIGVTELNKDDELYIYVGSSDRYNGGGIPANMCCPGYGYNGGGATHIALDSGLLSTLVDHATDGRILIVAGGGGGAAYAPNNGNNASPNASSGGHGGGYNGGTSTRTNTVFGFPNAGSQELISGTSFGLGGNGSGYGGGGGGGYYGGAGGYGMGGAGGSGYIASSNLVSTSDTTKAMYCYGCTEEFMNTNTLTISTTGSSDLRDATACPNGYDSNPVSKCAKTGNGYAKITYLGNN